ncbi:MAG: MATE family efflux transporter [Clostridiales bacterium]|nr:MATE family efflux transporter [Clostridiales bacterium]
MRKPSKNLYKWILYLAAPIALQNIITMSVELTDNLMVGFLGDLALSEVYAAHQIQHILHMLVIGLGAALSILAGRYWGKRDTQSVKILIGIALKFSIGAGLLFLLITLFFPVQVIRLFSREPDVIAGAVEHLKVLRYSYIFFCITQVLMAAMRCVETVRIGTYLSFITFCANVFLNWVLIFGNLGAPALGAQGAAIATLIVRILETILMILYVRFIDEKLRIRINDLLKSKIMLVKDFLRYGSPVILGDIFWGINLAAQGAIIGRLGAAATASVSIANTIFSLLSVGVHGTAGASSVIIGQVAGAGDYKRVRKYARRLQVLFLIIGLASGALLFIAKDYIMLLYNVSGTTADLSIKLMTVLSITIIGTAYQMSSLNGIVRAGGSVYFVLINDLIFAWLFVIPSALIAAFVFHASPVAVFACLKSDQILKCAVAAVKVNRFNWIKNLTRESPASA